VATWTGQRFRQGVVLLADGLEVALLQVRDGISEAKAEARVEGARAPFLTTEVAHFKDLPCRYQFALASALLDQEPCAPFREDTRNAVFGDSDSERGLTQLAEAWVERHRGPGVRLSPGLLRQRALDAMVDHLSVLAYLRSQGWSLHLHQGLCWTFRWMNGEPPFAPPSNLRRMVFVELGPRIWP